MAGLTAAPALRWGVVGTGRIAHRFARDLALSADCDLLANASRDLERARAFAEACGSPRWYGSDEQLLADPEVDAVYVAVPHSAHSEVAARAVEAGKAVLVEKPFTVSAGQAQDLRQRARARSVFLMEAMWTRFLPHMVRIRELLDDQRLGDVRMVSAEHGVWFRRDPRHRMFDLRLGGGALLDLGVYPVSLASMVLGAPAEVVGRATFGDTGVDAQTSVTMLHDDGRVAVATSTMQTWLANRATIAGTDARIDVEPTWYRATSFTLTTRGGATERYEFPVEGTGLRFQAEEVARCVRDGLLESPVLPVAESCSIMRTLDTVRKQIGLVYPGE